METVTLLLLCIVLISCVVLNISVIYALLAGLALFCIYGRLKGYSWAQMADMIVFGLGTAKNILFVFILIGILTALWRACGTIPMIICYAVRLISPKTIVLTVFLLNCGVSVLTGTSFGTAATMGTVCMTVAASIGINPVLAGGAVMSGIFFGDRCSPVSTSALLVSNITVTDIYTNIRLMLRTALIPFLITCAVYAAMGLLSENAGVSADLRGLFGRAFNLHFSVLLPAGIILTLSAFRVNVRITMSASIIASVFICIFVQQMKVSEVFRFMVTGYAAADPEVGAMLNGGGIASMLKVIAIVCISSSYAGFFQKTEILGNVKKVLVNLNKKITPFGGTLVTSVAAAMITCSQTLAIILTYQLYKDIEPDSQKLAIDLENTAVVVAPLIPWSIAGAVPIAAIGAPYACLLAACFLYLLPAYIFIRRLFARNHGLSQAPG